MKTRRNNCVLETVLSFMRRAAPFLAGVLSLLLWAGCGPEGARQGTDRAVWIADGSVNSSNLIRPAASRVDSSVTATISVGAARAVAYGAGSIWVAASANDGSFRGWILRIDPATNRIVAKIPVRSVPGWEIGGGGLTVGDGSVWVTGGVAAPGGVNSPGHGSNAILIRIDPKRTGWSTRATSGVSSETTSRSIGRPSGC
jgi:hypothetical protein